MPARLLLVAIAIATALAAPPAFADDDDWVWSVQIENDMFGSGVDQHYTHGTRISAQVPLDDEGWLTRKVLHLSDRTPGYATIATSRVSYVLGQSMYTPSDITIPAPQPNDRPYAGWTYVGAAVETVRPKTTDIIELNVGIVGPSSYAEQIQTRVHDIVGSPEPRGWEHQLSDEPGIVLAYVRRWRDKPLGDLYGWSSDVVPHAGLNAGNIFTYGAIGATFRIGHNLATDEGPPRAIRPSLPGSDFFDADAMPGGYFFVGFEARAMARNIFLDGNTFRDSASVDKELLVGDIQAGFVLNAGSYRLALSQTIRSREFEGQESTDMFGALTLSVRF